VEIWLGIHRCGCYAFDIGPMTLVATFVLEFHVVHLRADVGYSLRIPRHGRLLVGGYYLLCGRFRYMLR